MAKISDSFIISTFSLSSFLHGVVATTTGFSIEAQDIA
jgi:hypothetical protein